MLTLCANLHIMILEGKRKGVIKMALKEIMESKGLNPYRVARLSKVNPSQIYRFLKGQNVGYVTLLKISRALKVEIEELI